MLEKQHHPVAFDITQRVKVHDKQILYVCNSDKEAQFLKNELLLFFETDEIGYYSDREILPYDRFSTTESIIQNRIQLLNGDKNSFKVVVTSCINLFIARDGWVITGLSNMVELDGPLCKYIYF